MNSVLTYAAEKLIINVITRRTDAAKKNKKENEFHAKMLEYRALGGPIALELNGDTEISVDASD